MMDIIKGWTKKSMLIEAVITTKQRFDKFDIIDRKIVRYEIPLVWLEEA